MRFFLHHLRLERFSFISRSIPGASSLSMSNLPRQSSRRCTRHRWQTTSCPWTFWWRRSRRSSRAPRRKSGWIPHQSVPRRPVQRCARWRTADCPGSRVQWRCEREREKEWGRVRWVRVVEKLRYYSWIPCISLNYFLKKKLLLVLLLIDFRVDF